VQLMTKETIHNWWNYISIYV